MWLRDMTGTVSCKRPEELEKKIIKTPEFTEKVMSVSNRQMNTNYTSSELQRTRGEMLKEYFDTLSPEQKLEFLATRDKIAKAHEIYKMNPDAWYMDPMLRKGEKYVTLKDVSTQTSESELIRMSMRSASKSEIKPKSILISRGEPIYHNEETIPFYPDLNVERDMDYNNWNTYMHICRINVKNHDVGTQGVSTFSPKSPKYRKMPNPFGNSLEQALNNRSKINDTKLNQLQNFDSINLNLRKNLEFQNVITDKFNSVAKCFDNVNSDLFYMMSDNLDTFKKFIILTALSIHATYIVVLFFVVLFKKVFSFK